MTSETFHAFADPLPEPMFLVTTSGAVIAANGAVERRLGVAVDMVRGCLLTDFLGDAPDDIAQYLRSCSRSRSLILSSLSLRRDGGEGVTCRAEGELVQPQGDATEAVLLLRLIPKASAVGQFVQLNLRIEELGNEIRRRRQAESEARQQAEQLRVTLRSIGDAVIVTDADGTIRMINPIAGALTGWTLEAATGAQLSDVFCIVNEDTREVVSNPALRALQQGKAVGLANHTLLVSRDGTERSIDDSAAPIWAEDGKLVGSVLVFRDVSVRRQAEEQLRQSERQFRQLADAMPQIVWTAEPDGTIDYMNRQWTVFTGLPGTSGNDGWSQLLHPDEAATSRARWADSVQTGTPFEMPLRLFDRQQQSFRWYLIRTVAVHDDEGHVVRWIGTATDIHAQKYSEESARFLAESSAELAGVSDYESTLQKVANLAVPHFADWCAVDVLDDAGRLRRLAVAHKDHRKMQVAEELMRQYPPDPEAADGSFEVMRTGTPEIVSHMTEAMIIAATIDEAHGRLIRELGLKSYLRVPLAVSGQTLGVLTLATAESGRTYSHADLAVATDLAHRASVAVQNTQLYQALRETDQRKDEFLATLAHELRNPLAPIRNALQILKMPRVDAATVARSRDMIDRQVEHLVRLADDLLDVSRVMKGKIELRRERVELATVVARAIEMVQPLVDALGHRLTVNVSTESLPVEGDLIRLSQVVGNLLTNAAKYTESGGHIWLSATRDGDAVEVRVRDTGIGIAPEMLTRIFDLFVQVDQASTRAQGGLGIGLTLVKNLVEMHNGTLVARSDGLTRGSEFIVRLPAASRTKELADSPDGEHADQAARSRVGHRILIVDDNRDAAESLAMLLGLQGHEVRVAFSGMEALEVTKAYKPAVLFLDIGMPGMDGYEVARRVRGQTALESVVLVALTGWGQQ